MFKISILVLILVVLILRVGASEDMDAEAIIGQLKGSNEWEESSVWVKKVCNRGFDSLRITSEAMNINDVLSKNKDLLVCAMYLKHGEGYEGERLREVLDESGSLLSQDNGHSEVLKRAEIGDGKTKYLQGFMMFYVNSPKEGREWILRSAKSGYVPAMILLSEVDRTDKRWLERAARKGSAEAARRLGSHYRWFGKDNHNAYFWYEKAAGYGDRCAKRELGDIHNSGLLGRVENRSSAAHWYRLAADDLDVEASFKLGRMYEKGIGVLQDYEQAIVLYKYAAHMGHVEAMYWIGRMHQDGKVHQRDLVRAHTYFNLAASLKDSEGLEGLGYWDLGTKIEDIIAARKQVERLMTRDQILDAQQLAKDWYPVIRNSHKVYVKQGCN